MTRENKKPRPDRSHSNNLLRATADNLQARERERPQWQTIGQSAVLLLLLTLLHCNWINSNEAETHNLSLSLVSSSFNESTYTRPNSEARLSLRRNRAGAQSSRRPLTHTVQVAKSGGTHRASFPDRRGPRARALFAWVPAADSHRKAHRSSGCSGWKISRRAERGPRPATPVSPSPPWRM